MNHRTASNAKTSLLFLLLIAFAGVVSAQNQVDQTFSAVPSGAAEVSGHVLQADGKVVIWGNALTADGIAKDKVARVNVDGSVDNSFTYCACGLISITNVLVQPDGKLLLVGSSAQIGAKVIRLNGDGSLDGTYNTAFAPGSPLFGGGFGTGVLVQPDGKFIVETTYHIGASTFRAVYRLNTDGSQDSAFTVIDLGGGSSGYTRVNTALLLPDGKLLLAIDSYGQTNTRAYLRRYNANGTADSTWQEPAFAAPGLPTFTKIDGLDRQADGSIVVGGRWDSVNGAPKANLVRLFDAGNVDMAYSPAGFTSGGQLQILADGKTLVTAAVGGGGNRIYRLDAAGSLDPTFVMDPAITDVIRRWTLDASGRIVFMGTTSGGGGLFRLNPNGDQDGSFNPKLGTVGSIYATAVEPDGQIIAAGTFTHMNGVARRSLVRLNADGSVDQFLDAGTGFSTPPSALLAQSDGKILAVGEFSSYNGEARTGMVRIGTTGSVDLLFNPTFSTRPEAMALQPDGKIVVVGSFLTVNGTGRTGIARLESDGTLDATFNPVIGGPNLGAVALQGDGKIVISGSFNGVNGFNRTNLARLNTDGSLDQSFNAGSISSSWRMALQSDGKVVLGTSTGLIRRNADGTADASFSTPVFSSTSSLKMNTIVIQADGSIVVGGLFNTVGSSTRGNLVRLSPTGALDYLFFPIGGNGEVRTISAAAGGKLIIGGSFNRFNNTVRAAIARLTTVAFHKPAGFDFDGDGRSDISVTRPGSVYTWYQLLGANYTFSQANFGQTGDVVTPADFDGDGRTDLAIFRPSNGQWWYLSSLDGSQRADTWGASGDKLLPSDYTGDGKADFVSYRPSTGMWYRLANDANPSAANIAFGAPGDKPLVGDFDGDGKADPAVFRPSTGVFWYAASSQGNAHRAVTWGVSTDIPAVADFDGDGKTDVAVYRPSDGVWWVLNSSNGSYTALTWGIAEDRPIPADYDGDGRADIAVFRPSTGTWYLLTSTSGFSGFQWGISTDIPSPGAFVP